MQVSFLLFFNEGTIHTPSLEETPSSLSPHVLTAEAELQHKGWKSPRFPKSFPGASVVKWSPAVALLLDTVQSTAQE